jgi:hypothetical protein
MRDTVLHNYIPHKTPKNPNFQKWFEYYRTDIINLFNISKEVINEHYNYDINFSDFVQLIYNSSSKYMFKE